MVYVRYKGAAVGVMFDAQELRFFLGGCQKSDVRRGMGELKEGDETIDNGYNAFNYENPGLPKVSCGLEGDVEIKMLTESFREKTHIPILDISPY